MGSLVVGPAAAAAAVLVRFSVHRSADCTDCYASPAAAAAGGMRVVVPVTPVDDSSATFSSSLQTPSVP